jgi:hypothetical protein
MRGPCPRPGRSSRPCLRCRPVCLRLPAVPRSPLSAAYRRLLSRRRPMLRGTGGRPVLTRLPPRTSLSRRTRRRLGTKCSGTRRCWTPRVERARPSLGAQGSSRRSEPATADLPGRLRVRELRRLWGHFDRRERGPGHGLRREPGGRLELVCPRARGARRGPAGRRAPVGQQAPVGRRERGARPAPGGRPAHGHPPGRAPALERATPPAAPGRAPGRAHRGARWGGAVAAARTRVGRGRRDGCRRRAHRSGGGERRRTARRTSRRRRQALPPRRGPPSGRRARRGAGTRCRTGRPRCGC